MMPPNFTLDMAGLLAPFCALAAGVVLMGLGALVALGLDERLRRTRALPRVRIAAVARSKRAGRPADPTHAAA